MTINSLGFTGTTVLPMAVAWLLTFTIHSTLLLGSVWVIERYNRPGAVTGTAPRQAVKGTA